MRIELTWPTPWLPLGVALALGLAGCLEETTNPAAPREAAVSQDKIDPALSMQIQKDEPAIPAASVDVLIQTRGNLTPEQRAALEKHGARVGSVMGDVLTASVPASSVAGIAALDFVVRIEMSKQQRQR